MMQLKREVLLRTILSQPSAPFREEHVRRTIIHELKNGGVPHFQDPVGNIVIGVNSKKEYLQLVQERTNDPLRLFMAHMDHPGFHGLKWLSRDRLAIKWHGGSPVEHLEGSAVWLADEHGWVGEGHLMNVKMLPSGKAIDTGTIELPIDDRRKSGNSKRLYGGFRFRETSWRKGELLYTKSADDLVGSFAITSLALDLFEKTARKNKSRIPFLAILTRAEEVGFIGALAHLEKGWLKNAKRPILCISLETSRTFPGAEIGKGPVVRLGDKSTVFDANMLRVFLNLAKEALPNRHQKRVMDGGTCEGTATMAYGFPTIGVSIPLGNYHNQSFEGGPDSAGPNGPAPEFVHIQDIDGMITLCRALMKPKINWSQPWREKICEFKKDLKNARGLLQLTCKYRSG